ncbi:LysM peptidoglycan-binding domain-containing protein [Zhihengliuella halotolerans]|uniref:LysM peptidoglycan-binding domain-containing protein n=1 Tax=Zhihengliuella halotolerans TaxID=370736 RepID=UPI000C7FEA4A|nr:LysM peptidoglycan-binding domain-containing protein [Zhihengliuella halotolerans]
MSFAPRTASFSQTAKVGRVERPGLKPITRVTGPGAREVSFTQTVASLDWQKDIESELDWLRKCARRGYKVAFSGLSGMESGTWWLIEKQDIEIIQRARNNKPSRASVSWSLVEAVDVSVTAAKPKKQPKKKTTPKKKKPVARTVKVKRGDTLWKLAAKHLGKGSRWPEIYKLNKSKIKNPNRISPGQVLKLPAK